MVRASAGIHAKVSSERKLKRRGEEMPLTPKGKKVLREMKKEYGGQKGKQIFYASINKGKIKGAH